MVGRSISPKAAIYDAPSYLDAVSEALHDEPAKYHEVIELLTDFQFSRINIKECLLRLVPLLDDHPNLLRGFKFFPPDADEAEKQINRVVFVREVKKHFHYEPAKYDEFYKIWEDYWAERIDAASVDARVREIIKDHQNLVLSYNVCVPSQFRRTNYSYQC